MALVKRQPDGVGGASQSPAKRRVIQRPEPDGDMQRRYFPTDEAPTAISSSVLQRLPAETLHQIFDYLRFGTRMGWVGHKAALYNVALTCRQFSQYAIPLLWRDITLDLIEDDTYQPALLQSLTPESVQNFEYTRHLTIFISKDRKSVSDTKECAEIYSTLTSFLSVYNYCAPYLTDLEMELVPFIPTDCAHDGIWALLNCSNDLIYQLVGQVATREHDFRTLKLTIGPKAWGYDVEFRPHMHQILAMLAHRITILRIVEGPEFLGPRLSAMPLLKDIEVHNVGKPHENDTIDIWSALSSFGIRNAMLINFSVPKDIKAYISQTLTSLVWNGVDDITTACMVCFTQLPHLKKCALNGGRVNSEERAQSFIIPEVACTKLFLVGFLNSFVPTGLVSAIAKRNPRLLNCYAPINLSDDDLLHLKIHCKTLRCLLMSAGDAITPQLRISKAGLDCLAEIRTLTGVVLHHTHASLLDEPLLLRLGRNNRLLKHLTVRIPQGVPRKLDRSYIRASLGGTSNFKRWFATFIYQERADLANGHWGISLDRVRKDERFLKFYLLPEA